MKFTQLWNGLMFYIFLFFINLSYQSYPTVPLQAWLPKSSGDTTETVVKKLASATSQELQSFLFPSNVDLTLLCNLNNPIVLVTQDIHYTDFYKLKAPGSVEWIKSSQAIAKYALDIGYIFNNVNPILEQTLSSKCPGKSPKTISMSLNTTVSDFQSLSTNNPGSFIVFTGVLSNTDSFLDKYQLLTPNLLAGALITIFLSFSMFVSLTFLSNIKGAKK